MIRLLTGVQTSYIPMRNIRDEVAWFLRVVLQKHGVRDKR